MSAAPEIMARLAGGSTWTTERLDRMVPTLTQEDLAGALAGLREGPAEVMYVKYLGHPIGRLHALVYDEARVMARRYRWPDGSCLHRRMARLAVAEVVASTTCRTCLGGGSVVSAEGERRQACGQCEGAGIDSLSWKDRTAILRIDHAGTRRDTPIGRAERDYYDAIYALVQGWESEGIGHLAWRLFGE